MPEGGSAPAGQSASSKGPDPLIGRVINDRFRVVSLIARGGMGKVYRAEQAPLGREVALKVLNPNYSGDSDPEFHKRFFLEASTTAKLTHPNTVSIFDYGRTDDDVYYIAMELLEGRTLHRTLREEGAFPAPRAMHVARQVCRSLREAHALGVIHRDLKPANIFLVRHGDESDFVKVLDFGLVKEVNDTGEDLTQTGLFMGSPKYMSPEQIRGEKVDGRADVYALGVILYEMLTSKVPFDRPNSVNILMAHVHEPPPPMKVTNPAADVPPALEQLVLRAMAKSPSDRFASMDAMLEGLKGLASDAGFSVTHSVELGTTGEHAIQTGGHTAVTLTGPTISGTPPAMALGSERPPRLEAEGAKRPSPLVWIAGAVALIAVAGAGLAVWMAGEEPDAPSPPVVTARPHAQPSTPPETEQVPAEQPRTAMVSLRSTPAGATVRVGERTYGPTPADLEWTGEDAARGRQVTFLFQLDGYRDYSVTRVITGDRLEVEAELEAIERVPRVTTRVRRPRPPRRSEGDQAVGPIKGYKLDPY